MASCTFCKADSGVKLLSCVCRKASYCSKECQGKDWKTHKPSCSLYIIREAPGKGKGLFATRKIKMGHIILEEYPLFPFPYGLSFEDYKANHFPKIDENTKAKILKLHDPAENLKALSSDQVNTLTNNNPMKHMMPMMQFWNEARSDEASKIMRIFTSNNIQNCKDPELEETDGGLYDDISRINHSCLPNATWSWVLEDFELGSSVPQRKQIRALKTIEKDEEIVINFQNLEHVMFHYGSRDFRRWDLLLSEGFLCKCSECSLEGKALEENERMRAEIWKKKLEFGQLNKSGLSGPGSNRKLKRVIKLTQEILNLLRKLDIRQRFVGELLNAYQLTSKAKMRGIPAPDPNVFRREALDHAKMYGDAEMNIYNQNCIYSEADIVIVQY